MGIEKKQSSHSESTAMTAATKFVRLSGDYGGEEFVMRRGGRLSQVTIAYESWGELSLNQDNAILIFTGLSPTAHACSSDEDSNKGWWEYMIGPGKPIDTDRFFVVCVNSLGGCFGSTGPSSIDPVSGKPYALTFPELTIEDIAKAGHHALQELGIDHLHAVVGASMGGMTALAYALQYPDELDYLISISGAARAMPYALAVRSLQREVVRSDHAWNDGNYSNPAEVAAGMLLARKLALLSYRSASEWHERFDRARIPKSDRAQKPFELEFQIESYVDYNARKFSNHFDPNSYLYLSRAMDWFDVADHGGSVMAGFAKIHAKRSLIIGVETDTLFPCFQQQEIADGLEKAGRKVDFVVLPSVNGHDSFLIDKDQFSPIMARFLQSTRVSLK